jgi:hypothetical protein
MPWPTLNEDDRRARWRSASDSDSRHDWVPRPATDALCKAGLDSRAQVTPMSPATSALRDCVGDADACAADVCAVDGTRITPANGTAAIIALAAITGVQFVRCRAESRTSTTPPSYAHNLTLHSRHGMARGARTSRLQDGETWTRSRAYGYLRAWLKQAVLR